MEHRRNGAFLAIGLAVAILIGTAAVFFASGDPDGLESTALVVQGDKTLTGETPPDATVREDIPDRFSFESPFPDYTLGKGWGSLGSILAIVAGTTITFGAILGISRLLARPARTGEKHP